MKTKFEIIKELIMDDVINDVNNPFDIPEGVSNREVNILNIHKVDNGYYIKAEWSWSTPNDGDCGDVSVLINNQLNKVLEVY